MKYLLSIFVVICLSGLVVWGYAQESQPGNTEKVHEIMLNTLNTHTITLYQQRKFAEAEQAARQAVDYGEKTLARKILELRTP
ncbi:MAG: hypothetical protein RBT80_07575 [Candidatus Vecturithrix sp.]|jgi:hypothetical protein|nr:hypothetical protein [Candidatus Vecturithrix sp.]